MITKIRFASSRIILLAITTSLLSLSAQADILSPQAPESPAQLEIKESLITLKSSASQPGAFQKTLGDLALTADQLTSFKTYYLATHAGEVLDEGSIFLNMTVDDLRRLRVLDASTRMRDALDLGYLILEGGNKIAITLEEGLAIFLDTVESADLTPIVREGLIANLRRIAHSAGIQFNGPLVTAPAPMPNQATDGTHGKAISPIQNTDILMPLLGSLSPGNNGNSGLLPPLANAVDGLGHGAESHDALLAPITNLVSEVSTGLNGDAIANNGLLSPVTSSLVSSLSGGLAGGETANRGLLTPVTNLAAGLVGGLQGGVSPEQGAKGGTTNNGLLTPVTGLVSGLLGGPPR